MDWIVIPAIDRVNEDLAERLRGCGQFVHMVECDSCGADHYAGFQRCRSRWCISCNHVRSLLWIARLYPILREWMLSGRWVCMMNLTVRDGPDLSGQLQMLQECWRKMYHGSSYRRKHWLERFPGGVRSLEVKLGEGSGLWHSHYHSLVLQDSREPDFVWVRDLWKDVVREQGSEGSVWLKEIRRRGLMKSIIESLKYILKPELSLYDGDHDAELGEAIEVLRGKRQADTWGLLRGVAQQVEEDMAHGVDEKKLTDFVCQRCGCTAGHLQSLLYSTAVGRRVYDLRIKTMDR